jgi:hypothetical protein
MALRRFRPVPPSTLQGKVRNALPWLLLLCCLGHTSLPCL